MPEGKEKGIEWFNCPFSPTTDIFDEILNWKAGMTDIARLKDNRKEYTVTIDGKEMFVAYKSEKASVAILVENMELLEGSNKGAKKIFTLLLEKANEQQVIHDGQVTKPYISFTLQELVDKGIYSDLRSARAGFWNSMDIISSLKIKEYSLRGNKPKQKDLFIPFYRAKIRKGQCLVKVETETDWSVFAPFYTRIPSYYYRQDNRTSDFIKFVFERARQNIDEIAKKGYFTISVKSLQARLNLPDETCSKPKRLILDPIEKGMNVINNQGVYVKDKESGDNGEIVLTPLYCRNDAIHEILDNGYIRVDVKGETLKYYTEFFKKAEKERKAAEKKAEKAKDRAIKKQQEKTVVNQLLERVEKLEEAK